MAQMTTVAIKMMLPKDAIEKTNHKRHQKTFKCAIQVCDCECFGKREHAEFSKVDFGNEAQNVWKPKKPNIVDFLHHVFDVVPGNVTRKSLLETNFSLGHGQY